MALVNFADVPLDPVGMVDYHVCSVLVDLLAI